MVWGMYISVTNLSNGKCLGIFRMGKLPFWGVVFELRVGILGYPQAPDHHVSYTSCEVSQSHCGNQKLRMQVINQLISTLIFRVVSHILRDENLVCLRVLLPKGSWWLNPSIWKICSSNWTIPPGFGVKSPKIIWNLHPGTLYNDNRVSTSSNRKYIFKCFTSHGHVTFAAAWIE